MKKIEKSLGGATGQGIFSYFAGMILLPKLIKWGGVPKKNTIFIFSESP